jgi:hypothetical protein
MARIRGHGRSAGLAFEQWIPISSATAEGIGITETDDIEEGIVVSNSRV